ncbi:LysM peptidoglycan-binding domain-containing protein [Thermaerobacter marianensis]|uniref:LysM peptidoglycan-binding domain-containing protein n=1 Tax=Thermaerobacter marianensis TaxID=73919 RepID=UPI0002D73671|nr:LysM peptidoglycan-binding domain-containing protein [Thermaerobacter marianensis]
MRPDGSVVVVVRPGDTLWEVAQRYGRTDRDPRDVVAAIMEASGLSTAQLRPGMVLVVPAALARR